MNIKDLIRDVQPLINSGKVLHVAISDTPAWMVAIANTYAEEKGWHPFVAYQGRYSLADRSSDQDINPMSRALNIGLVPWGVLGQGKLTGTRTRDSTSSDTQRKIEMTEQDFVIQDEILKIAKEVNRSPSQVALNWVLQQPGVPSAIVGPRTADQLEDLLHALEWKLTDEQEKRLSELSKDTPNIIFPHTMLVGTTTQTVPWLYTQGRKFNVEN
jgi:aryl-alcohol dehydrogenase-like predicted oxidoreductase